VEGQSAQLTIPSQLDRMLEVRLWVVEHAGVCGFDDRTLADIELAVTEALSNIIRHSYGGEAGHEIELELVADTEHLSLTIQDSGIKFDRSAYEIADLDAPRAGGYGVFLIEETMDEVEWDTSPRQGTRLRMVKYRTGERRE